jgi:flagellar biosynthetic protein FliQ
MNWLIGPVREGLVTVLVVAGPIIVVATVIGLSVGIAQAATQIQDQSISTGLKIFGILATLFGLSSYMYNQLSNFTEGTFGKAFTLATENQDRLPVAVDEQSPGEPKSISSSDSGDASRDVAATFTRPFGAGQSISQTSQTTLIDGPQDPGQSFAMALKPPEPKVRKQEPPAVEEPAPAAEPEETKAPPQGKSTAQTAEDKPPPLPPEPIYGPPFDTSLDRGTALSSSRTPRGQKAFGTGSRDNSDEQRRPISIVKPVLPPSLERELEGEDVDSQRLSPPESAQWY